MANVKVKKALGVLSKIFTVIIVAITVFMMIFTIISSLTFDRNDRNLFGIRFYVVLSDSMSLSDKNADDKVHFDAGDIVLIKNVKDVKALKEGEVIAFISQNSDNFGETVTHKIREVVINSKGTLIGYRTYGTNTGSDDETLVEPNYVIGSYAGRLPKLGYFFQFLKTTPGYIVCILIPFLLLILWQGIDTVRLFRQYKKEQMAEMEAEREQIALEREQSAAMMLELQALRDQLAKQNGGEAPATPETPEKPAEAEENSSTPAADGSDDNQSTN